MDRKTNKYECKISKTNFVIFYKQFLHSERNQ